MSRLSLILLVLSTLSCESRPDCAVGDYQSAECRVVAENHYARILTSTGVEVRFQALSAVDERSWDALGLVQEPESGVVRLRPSTLMGFQVSFAPRDATAARLDVVIDNIAPDMALSLGPAGALVPLDAPGDARLQRRVAVDLDGETLWLRGERPCPLAYRLAVAGDIQTNPLQFERILQDLHQEMDLGEADGAPLLGLLLVGDLTQDAVDDEFLRIEELLVNSPVPVAVTAGNHDKAGDDYARYNRHFGPGNYAFDVCDTRVVLLDTGDGTLAPSIEGRLPELLDREGRAHFVFGTHYVVYPGRTGAGMRDQDQAAYLLAELARQGVDRLMVGHQHYWQEFKDIAVGDARLHEIVTGTAGATQGEGHPRYGVTRLTFDESGVQSCFHEVPPPGTIAPGQGSVVGFIDFCAP